MRLWQTSLNICVKAIWLTLQILRQLCVWITAALIVASVISIITSSSCLAYKKIWLRLLRVRECVSEEMSEINRVPDARASRD